MHCAWRRDYHRLVLLTFNLIIQRYQLTNLAEVTVQRLCYCNSNTRGMTQQITKWSHWHKRITDQLILQNGKKLQGVQDEQ